MNDITALTPEKLDEIRQRYSPVAVPKCHICGAEMTIGAATAARVVYACSGATYDDAGCHYAPGRSIADDHYAQSRVTVVDVSDPDVLAVVEELEKAQQAANINNWWKPDVCPITGRRFFMWIEHPDLGYVPTYGGPYDSYTIPTRDDVGEFSCERYDHDFGGWVDDECAGLYVIDEDEICRVHELEQSVAELVTGRLNLMRTMGVYVHAYEEAKAQVAKDVEIKARLCRESNSLFDRLRAAEKRIAELEKAVSEPVAYTDDRNLGYINRGREMAYLWGKQNSEAGDIPLYSHAQPATVVPDEIAAVLITAIEKEQDRLFGEDYLMDSKDCVDVIREEIERLNACRAAMCATEKASNHGVSQGEYSENCASAPVHNGATHAPESVQSVGQSLAGIKAASVLDSLPKNVESPSGMDTEKLNQPVSKTNALPASVVDALEKALQAMSFMGDTLNNLDAVCEEDVEYVSPAFEAVRSVLENNSPVTPDGWKEEAEKLAEAYGAAFVIFRHGEEPVCADPTKFWFGFDPAAPKEVG